MDTHYPPKIPPQYNCELCNYNTVSKKDYNKHLLTRKHMRITNDAAGKIEQIQQNNNLSVCICGKAYKYRQGLYKHRQTCEQIHPPSHEENIQTTIEPIEPNSVELLVLVKELMIQMAAKDKQQDELIKQNLELQNTMKEMIPHLGNNNTINSNNPTFNVQFFLENDCRNAQSIQEFVKSIEFNHEHLVSMTKDGYVDTISNILIQALNKMAITDRPLHCTDLKRETVYIKDKESWNKSTADAPLMNRVINCIEKGCVIEVKNYVDKTPQSKELDTPEYDFYHKAHWNTLGAGEDSNKLNKKIYKKVLPQVKLDKKPA